MNKLVCLLIFAGALSHCKSTGEVVFNFDRQARALQEKINDRSFTFYHEKHAAKLEVPLVLPSDFRSERELKSGSFIYRLDIDESGKFTVQAIKPPPYSFEPQIMAVVNSLRFKPAWIGPKNFKSVLEIHFMVEYEAY